MITRLDKTELLLRRAERLHRFCEVNAPEFIIEQARQLLFKSMISFPVDQTALRDFEEFENNSQLEMDKYLEKGGYFKDIDNV